MLIVKDRKSNTKQAAAFIFHIRISSVKESQDLKGFPWFSLQNSEFMKFKSNIMKALKYKVQELTYLIWSDYMHYEFSNIYIYKVEAWK